MVKVRSLSPDKMVMVPLSGLTPLSFPLISAARAPPAKKAHTATALKKRTMGILLCETDSGRTLIKKAAKEPSSDMGGAVPLWVGLGIGTGHLCAMCGALARCRKT